MLNITCACMLAPVVLRGTGQTRFQRSEESELSHSKCIFFFSFLLRVSRHVG